MAFDWICIAVVLFVDYESILGFHWYGSLDVLDVLPLLAVSFFFEAKLSVADFMFIGSLGL